jgi:predicted nuclease with TOPRIM domain
VVEELKLMEDNAAYRLEVTMDIISWGLDKRTQGYDLTELDHHLYFEEKKGKRDSEPKEPSKRELLKQNPALKAKVEELELKVCRLEVELCLRHS